MEPVFDPAPGEGWQISNIPILSLAPYLASVEMFDEGMDAIIER
jgi:kynureninase